MRRKVAGTQMCFVYFFACSPGGPCHRRFHRDWKKESLCFCAWHAVAQSVPKRCSWCLSNIYESLVPFSKKRWQEYDLSYHANKSSWMTVILFYSWLKHFDFDVKRTSRRKVLPCTDNCAAHRTLEIVHNLENIEAFSCPQLNGVELSFWTREQLHR